MNRNRLTYVDAAKAIAICFVILGHTVSRSGQIFPFVFGFHMPAFFFFSGYCTKENFYYTQPFRSFVKRKAKSLLIPYAVFSLIGLLFVAFFADWRNDAGFRYNFLQYVYYAQPVSLGSVWFLVCLFVSFLGMYGILKLTDRTASSVTGAVRQPGIRHGNTAVPGDKAGTGNKTGIRNEIRPGDGSCPGTETEAAAGKPAEGEIPPEVRKKKTVQTVLTLLIMAILAYAGTELIPGLTVPRYTRLPWKIDSASVAVIFLLLGYLCKTEKWLKKIPEAVRSAGLFLLPAAAWYTAVLKNGYVNICDCEYSDPVYYFISSVAGTLWLMDLGWVFKESRMLTWLGRNSLVIFGIHTFPLWIATEIYWKIVGGEPHHLPDNLWAVLITFAVYGVCAAAAAGWNRLTAAFSGRLS